MRRQERGEGRERRREEVRGENRGDEMREKEERRGELMWNTRWVIWRERNTLPDITLFITHPCRSLIMFLHGECHLELLGQLKPTKMRGAETYQNERS